MDQITGISFESELFAFIGRWSPENPKERKKFLEDLRRFSAASRVAFHNDRIRGCFEDGTGEQYLRKLVGTFKEG